MSEYADIKPARDVAKVTFVADDGRMVRAALRNRTNVDIAFNNEATSLRVGDVIFVEQEENQIEPSPPGLWADERWIGVVRLVVDELTVVTDGAGHLRRLSTPPNPAVKEGNTVECDDSGVLDDEQGEMLLRAEPRTDRPKTRDLAALSRLAADGKFRDWVLNAAQLRRGDLLELEVELAAEEIYGVSQTMSSLLSILQEDSQAFGVGNSDALRYGMLMTRVLDALLVRLVPIRARSRTWSCVTEVRNLSCERSFSKT